MPKARQTMPVPLAFAKTDLAGGPAVAGCLNTTRGSISRTLKRTLRNTAAYAAFWRGMSSWCLANIAEIEGTGGGTGGAAPAAKPPGRAVAAAPAVRTRRAKAGAAAPAGT